MTESSFQQPRTYTEVVNEYLCAYALKGLAFSGEIGAIVAAAYSDGSAGERLAGGIALFGLAKLVDHIASENIVSAGRDMNYVRRLNEERRI